MWSAPLFKHGACSMGTGTTATGTTAQLQQHNTASTGLRSNQLCVCMGDTCYPWEYEDEVPTGIFTPHCHPGSHEDSLLCFFRLSYCLWYDSLEQLGHWHWDEIMAGFRACGVVVMVLWFLEFARAMHGDHSLPEVPEPAAAAVDEDVPEPAAAVDEDRPELAAALDEERPELAAVEERPVPELLCSAPPGREDGLTLAIQALTRSVDNLAVAFNGMRPGSVAPGSVVPWRASAGPRQRRRQRCKECGPCLAKLAAGVSRPPCESWAAVPGLERDSAGRFLPRTPAKREPAGDESDALDMAEEFNIDDLLASPVSAEKKSKSKKRRKLPPDLSSDRHKDHRDGHGGAGDGTEARMVGVARQ